MNEVDPSPRRGPPLIRIVLILWVGMYLWMMSAADWPWNANRAPGAQGVLGIGTVPDATLKRFGSAVPTRILDGDWQRPFTGAALHATLLNLLLLSWWWSSLVKGMRSIAGVGAVVLTMIAGGVGGNWVHAMVYPESGFAGPGPFGWVAALIGLQLGLGLFGKLPGGRRLVGSALFSLLFVGVLIWLFGGGRAWDDEHYRPLLGIESLGTSLGIGALLPLLLGAPTFARGTNALVKPLAWVAVLAWVGAFAVQLPRTVQAGEAGAAKTFLKSLWEAEVQAQQIYEDGRDARRRHRVELHEALNALKADPFVERLKDPASLMAYIDAMRRVASGDMRDPHAVLVGCRRALRTWYETEEQQLRRDYGIEPRATHRIELWERS